MNGKIICIWGSPGSGKTLTSLAVAAKLAAQKKNVVMINNCKILPSLKVFVPTKQISAAQSIGTLLMSNRLDDASVASRFVFHPDNEYIAFMGRSPGDTYITYSQFSQENIVRLLNRLIYITDYIIVDADTVIADDEIAMVAMELASYQVFCVTPDTKGIVYFNATMPFFQEEKFSSKPMLKVLGNVRDISPVPEVMQIFGKFDIMLPYSYEVESKYIGGELIQGMNRTDGIEYEEEIGKLVEVFLNEAEQKPENGI